MRRAERAVEYLDRPVPAADRDASLADVDRLNAWFNGYRLTLRAVDRLAAHLPAGRTLSVVDVGGGRGDFAAQLMRWAARRGRTVHVTVVDRAPKASRPGVRYVCADAAALPFRERSVDIVTANLLLHHLEPGEVVRCLGAMAGAARLGIVVNDLLRTPLTLAMVWLATRLLACHRFSRHDGPLSVRRAHSPDELHTLGAKAGVHHLDVLVSRVFGRVIAVAETGR